MPSSRSNVNPEADQFIKILTAVLPLSGPRKWDQFIWPANLPVCLVTAYENAYGKSLDLTAWREVKQALQLAVPLALTRWLRTTDVDLHYAAGALVWFQYAEPLLHDFDSPQSSEVQARL